MRHASSNKPGPAGSFQGYNEGHGLGVLGLRCLSGKTQMYLEGLDDKPVMKSLVSLLINS